MRRSTAFLVGLVLAFKATSALGSEKPKTENKAPATADSLEPLAWLVGDWLSDEFTSTVDLGAVKKNDCLKAHVSVRWGPNRQYLFDDGYILVNGRRIYNQHDVNSLNTGKKQIDHAIFGYLGTGKGFWSKVGDESIIQWTTAGKEGMVKGTSFFQKKDADTYTWQARDMTIGNNKLPDTPIITYRRMVGAAKGELWKAVCDRYKGTWTGEGAVIEDSPSLGLKAGDKFTCRLTFKLDKADTAVSADAEFRAVGKDAKLTGQGIVGWDAQQRQVRTVMFWSNGSLEEVAITGQVENGFVGTYVNKIVGKPPVRMQVRYEYPDDKSCILKSTGRQGVELSTWKKVGD